MAVVEVFVVVVGADLLAARTSSSHSSHLSSSSMAAVCDKLISFAFNEGAMAGGNEPSIAVLSLSHRFRHSLVFASVVVSLVNVVDFVVGGAVGGLTGRELSGNLDVDSVWFVVIQVEGVWFVIVVGDDEVESIG